MRRIFIFIVAAIPLLTACASSKNVINDDAYYSPYDKNSSYDNTLVTSNSGYFDANTVKTGSDKVYTDYTVANESEAAVDTVYIIEEVPETHVTIEFVTGFNYGYGWVVYYNWDPFWDTYWYPHWSPYWSYSGYYWGHYWDPYWGWGWGGHHPYHHFHPYHPYDPHHPYNPYISHYAGNFNNSHHGAIHHGGGININNGRRNKETPNSGDVTGGATHRSSATSANSSEATPKNNDNVRRPAASTRSSANSENNSATARPSASRSSDQNASRPNSSARPSSQSKNYTPANNNRRSRSSSEYVRPQSSTRPNSNVRSNSSAPRNNSSNVRSNTSAPRSNSSNVRSSGSAPRSSGSYSGGSRSGSSGGGSRSGGGRR